MIVVNRHLPAFRDLLEEWIIVFIHPDCNLLLLLKLIFNF